MRVLSARRQVIYVLLVVAVMTVAAFGLLILQFPNVLRVKVVTPIVLSGPNPAGAHIVVAGGPVKTWSLGVTNFGTAPTSVAVYFTTYQTNSATLWNNQLLSPAITGNPLSMYFNGTIVGPISQCATPTSGCALPFTARVGLTSVNATVLVTALAPGVSIPDFSLSFFAAS
jgi:hypothetical protein